MTQKEAVWETTWFYLFFPACVGPYMKWSLVFSERQAVAIYRYAAEKARNIIVTHLVPSNGHIKGIWWEDLQARKKQFRKLLQISSVTYYWSFQIFFCPQLSARGFGKQLHKTITMILIRTESSLQYANAYQGASISTSWLVALPQNSAKKKSKNLL